MVSIALSILLGWSVMITPAPLGREAEFSAYRMADHIRVIAEEERSVFHPERRMYVRDYIIGVMEGYGLTAEIDDFVVMWPDYAGREIALEGSNVFFRIPGRSNTAIMLMAHYDSRGVDWTLHPDTDVRSPGASDAGYGIATMLEIARNFATRDDLENSIYFFFTDLEEIWMLGAVHAVETMDFSNVNMILNLEARGIRGPVYMFETNDRDFNVVRFFRDSTRHRFSYSLATAIFRIMQNDTDLSPFLEQGFAGMNFAPLDSIMYYHSELDSYENISLTTLQHYIEMIAEIVEFYATNSRFSDVNYFVSDHSGVYFSMPFGYLILYTGQTAVILAVIMLILMLALVFYSIYMGNACIWKILSWLLYIIIAMVVAAAIGLVISNVVSFVTDVPFNLMYMRVYSEMYIKYPSVIFAIIGFGLFHCAMRKRYNRHEMAIGAMLLLTVVNILLVFVMVEATFIAFVPLALTFIFFILSEIRAKNAIWFYTTATLPMAFMGIFILPTLRAFTLALTIGGLAIVMAMAVFMVISIFPLWCEHESQ